MDTPQQLADPRLGGAPTAKLVYKLVARANHDDPHAPLRPVAKASAGKPTHKGRKWAARQIDQRGVATAEVLVTRPPTEQHGRPLLVPLVRRGDIVGRESLEASRVRHVRSRDELPPSARQLSRGDPAVPTIYQEDAT